MIRKCLLQNGGYRGPLCLDLKVLMNYDMSFSIIIWWGWRELTWNCHLLTSMTWWKCGETSCLPFEKTRNVKSHKQHIQRCWTGRYEPGLLRVISRQIRSITGFALGNFENRVLRCNNFWRMKSCFENRGPETMLKKFQNLKMEYRDPTAFRK